MPKKVVKEAKEMRRIVPKKLRKFAKSAPGFAISGPIEGWDSASDRISHWLPRTNANQPTTIHCISHNLEQYDILLGRK